MPLYSDSSSSSGSSSYSDSSASLDKYKISSSNKSTPLNLTAPAEKKIDKTNNVHTASKQRVVSDSSSDDDDSSSDESDSSLGRRAGVKDKQDNQNNIRKSSDKSNDKNTPPNPVNSQSGINNRTTKQPVDSDSDSDSDDSEDRRVNGAKNKHNIASTSKNNDNPNNNKSLNPMKTQTESKKDNKETTRRRINSDRSDSDSSSDDDDSSRDGYGKGATGIKNNVNINSDKNTSNNSHRNTTLNLPKAEIGGDSARSDDKRSFSQSMQQQSIESNHHSSSAVGKNKDASNSLINSHNENKSDPPSNTRQNIKAAQGRNEADCDTKNGAIENQKIKQQGSNQRNGSGFGQKDNLENCSVVKRSSDNTGNKKDQKMANAQGGGRSDQNEQTNGTVRVNDVKKNEYTGQHQNEGHDIKHSKHAANVNPETKSSDRSLRNEKSMCNLPLENAENDSPTEDPSTSYVQVEEHRPFPRRSSIGNASNTEGLHFRYNFNSTRPSQRRSSLGAGMCLSLEELAVSNATVEDPLAVAKRRMQQQKGIGDFHDSQSTHSERTMDEDGIPIWKKKLLEKKRIEEEAEMAAESSVPAWKKALLEKKKKSESDEALKPAMSSASVKSTASYRSTAQRNLQHHQNHADSKNPCAVKSAKEDGVVVASTTTVKPAGGTQASVLDPTRNAKAARRLSENSNSSSSTGIINHRKEKEISSSRVVGGVGNGGVVASSDKSSSVPRLQSPQNSNLKPSGASPKSEQLSSSKISKEDWDEALDDVAEGLSPFIKTGYIAYRCDDTCSSSVSELSYLTEKTAKSVYKASKHGKFDPMIKGGEDENGESERGRSTEIEDSKDFARKENNPLGTVDTERIELVKEKQADELKSKLHSPTQVGGKDKEKVSSGVTKSRLAEDDALSRSSSKNSVSGKHVDEESGESLKNKESKHSCASISSESKASRHSNASVSSEKASKHSRISAARTPNKAVNTKHINKTSIQEDCSNIRKPVSRLDSTSDSSGIKSTSGSMSGPRSEQASVSVASVSSSAVDLSPKSKSNRASTPLPECVKRGNGVQQAKLATPRRKKLAMNPDDDLIPKTSRRKSSGTQSSPKQIVGGQQISSPIPRTSRKGSVAPPPSSPPFGQSLPSTPQGKKTGGILKTSKGTAGVHESNCSTPLVSSDRRVSVADLPPSPSLVDNDKRNNRSRVMRRQSLAGNITSKPSLQAKRRPSLGSQSGHPVSPEHVTPGISTTRVQRRQSVNGSLPASQSLHGKTRPSAGVKTKNVVPSPDEAPNSNAKRAMRRQSMTASVPTNSSVKVQIPSAGEQKTKKLSPTQSGTEGNKTRVGRRQSINGGLPTSSLHSAPMSPPVTASNAKRVTRRQSLAGGIPPSQLGQGQRRTLAGSQPETNGTGNSPNVLVSPTRPTVFGIAPPMEIPTVPMIQDPEPSSVKVSKTKKFCNTNEAASNGRRAVRNGPSKGSSPPATSPKVSATAGQSRIITGTKATHVMGAKRTGMIREDSTRGKPPAGETAPTQVPHASPSSKNKIKKPKDDEANGPVDKIFRSSRSIKT